MSFDNEFKEVLRKRMGLESDDESLDDHLQNLSGIDRFKMLVGWHIGDDSWAYSIDLWLRSQGLCIAERVDKIGVNDPLLKKVDIL